MNMRCCVVFCLMFICFEFGFVDGLKSSQKGVCVSKHTVTKTRPKTVLVPTSKWCGPRKCTVRQTRKQKYTVVTNQLMCCKGFVYTSDNDSCAPVCSTGCANGTCVEPDVCHCAIPLYLDLTTKNKCLTPTCDHLCINGMCTANNTCRCKDDYLYYNATHCVENCTAGFELNSLSCVPKCDNCNGKCVAPNRCECLPGYKMYGTCQPQCDHSCVNGRCVAPNTCECDGGYEKRNASVCERSCECRPNGTCLTTVIEPRTRNVPVNVTVPCKSRRGRCTEIRMKPETYEVEVTSEICCDTHTYNSALEICEPNCEKGCVNGKCVKPDVCSCEPPLTLNTSSIIHTCVPPVCETPCVHGTCTGPNRCTCDHGYTIENNTCVAQCTNCTHGDCISPNVCHCHDGYVMKDGKCTPQCESCSNGVCSAPNTCTCNDGYEMVDNICKPICKKPCVNGKCTAPDTCECNEGFEANGDKECAPKCKYECTHGFCSAPNVCTCDDGYEFKNNKCRPICKKPCVYGECVAPSKCECYDGYESKGNHTEICIPICKTDCKNGICAGPNVCICNSGYTLEDNKCKPICGEPCIHGTCVAPNTCDCSKGFEKADNFTCKPKCELCAHGVCTAPNKCECNTGYSLTLKGCEPTCEETCVNGYCSAPNKCSCKIGYTRDAMNSSICHKPCGVCNHGSCEDGKCICEADMDLINGTCVVSMPSEISGMTSTGLASVQMTWWVGGAVVLLLTVLVLVVISRLWHNRKDFPQKAADDGAYGSVAYTVPNTLFRKDDLVEEDEPSDTLLEKETNLV